MEDNADARHAAGTRACSTIISKCFLLSGDALSVSDLESQYAAFESAGLVVIYSCDKLPSETKRKFGALAADGFFDFSALRRVGDESGAVRKLISDLRSLGTDAGDENPRAVN